MGNPDKQNQGGNGDVESQRSTAAAAATTTAPAAGGGGRVVITMTWKKEEMLEKGPLVLRALALLFSFISFVVMSCNHGFTNSDDYKYLFSIGIIATVYTAAQTILHLFAKQALDPCTSALHDFIGDQVMAYLLISSVSCAIPTTNLVRAIEKTLAGETKFDDYGAASISMAFFAFFSLALSSLISGFKLSTLS